MHARNKHIICYRIRLRPNEKPEVKLKNIKGATIYAYCNKHGLWAIENK